MVGIFLAFKLDAKIINYQCECYRVSYMLHQSWGELVRTVTSLVHLFYHQTVILPTGCCCCLSLGRPDLPFLVLIYTHPSFTILLSSYL